MIEFVEKEPWYDDSPFIGDCYMYPNFMVKDGKELFMFNRRSPQTGYEDFFFTVSIENTLVIIEIITLVVILLKKNDK